MSHDRSDGAVVANLSHSEALEILAASRPANIKAVAEQVLEGLGEVSVVTNRTGLVMLPFQDTAKGTVFHLGEVLVAEAHIEVPGYGVEGYGAVVGRDLEHAMAMAVIDAAIAAKRNNAPIIELLDAERAHQDETDRERLRDVEATRVQMETF
jgi:alpha-D-ribose 1-methylphosphonate 5-triphosphate synthase subunit PhnG